MEWGRKVAERVARGRLIATVWCDADPIVFDGVTPSAVEAALVGARVLAVKRHGKHLWFELDRALQPLFHFGMTGAFRTPDAKTLELAATPRSGDGGQWPPRWTKIHLVFDDGGELVMTNKRRLGRIRLRAEPRAEPPISKLGFDPLTSLPGEAEFGRLLRRRKSPLKAVLLNQGFAAGVGNWLADEILYQGRVDPRLRADRCTDAQVTTLHRVLSEVVREAVRVDADKARFPEEWLFHRRWGRNEGAVTIDGVPIEFMDLAGRTTAWVPALQRDAALDP